MWLLRDCASIFLNLAAAWPQPAMQALCSGYQLAAERKADKGQFSTCRLLLHSIPSTMLCRERGQVRQISSILEAISHEGEQESGQNGAFPSLQGKRLQKAVAWMSYMNRIQAQLKGSSSLEAQPHPPACCLYKSLVKGHNLTGHLSHPELRVRDPEGDVLKGASRSPHSRKPQEPFPCWKAFGAHCVA